MNIGKALFWFLIINPSQSWARASFSSILPIKNEFVVIIDAGHGGKDHGTSGKVFKEKDLALKISLHLGQILEETYPNVKVKYTRTEDQFIPLYKRVDLANKINADLFISIHCNYASNKKIYGTETYVMGMQRADENLALAKRENDVILLESNYEENYDGYDPNSPIGHILLASVQNAYLSQSLAIAASIEENLSEVALKKSRGVKQAGFAVLRRATMPSILIETGFLSNEEEENYLGSHKGQSQICHSIVLGLKDFFTLKDKSPETSSSIVTSHPVQKQIDKKIKVLKSIEEVAKVEKKIDLLTTNTEINKKTYRIQIAALRNKMDEATKLKLSRLGVLHEVVNNGMFKYQLGDYADIALANRDKVVLKNEGYHATFIIER